MYKMSNYNFTPTLNGLNNIEADEITASSGSIDKLNIGTLTGDTLTNCNLINCTVSSNPTVNLGIAPKQYVDLCPKLSESNIFTGGNYFNNNVEFDDYVTFNQDITINGSTTFMDSNGFTTMNGTLLLENLVISKSAVFGGICPSSTVTPTTNNHLCRLRFLNDNFVKLNATQIILGNTTISGSTIFNVIPTTEIVPSTQMI